MRGGEGAGLGLVAGSFDLVERFALFRREPQCFGELPRARRDALLGRWQALLGGEAALERRLALEGLDRAAAARALGPITLADDYPRPPWLDIIGDVLDAMREGTGEPTLAELAELEAEGDDSEPLPFAHYYRPWVRVGLARLERQVGERWLRLAARPRRQLARALARELARAGTQTLLGELDAKRAASNTPRAEGAPPTVIYDGLVAELHGARAAALLAGYPCLARLWATRLDLWVASSAELLARVDADRAQLEATFGARGELSALDLSLSDPHDGGRQVAALRFADGQAVIYKPKDLTTERAFFALVAWLEARDAPLPALRALRVLERDGYGYVERVAPAPCPDEAALAQFERRSGALLALVHVLQGVDYHHENLIAAADQPLLVDHETLLAPALPDAGDEASADDHAAIRLARSVLRTGLLPQPSREPGGFVGDHSGLGAREAAGARTAYRFEGAPNSDEMRIVPTERIVSQASQPRLRDGGARASTREAAAQRRARVLEGFRCTYDALAAHADTLAREDGGPLAALRSAWTRVVLRPTTTYDTLLRHSRRPTLLRDAVVRGLSFDRLAPAALEDGAPPWALPVLRAEHRALWRGDVPRFLARADGTGLFARDAVGAEQHAPLEIAGDVLPMAPWQALHRGLRALGPDDLHLQSALIETSLHAASAARQRLHGAPAETGVAESASPAKLAADGGGGAARDSRPAAEPRTLALAIADRLLCDAVDVSGARQHVGVDLDPSSGLPTVGLLGPTLYSGRAGVALFLAAAHRAASEGTPYRAGALAALAPLADELERRPAAVTQQLGLGGFDGVGGLLWAMVQVGRLADEPRLVEVAARAALALPRALLERAEQADLVSGLAGLLLALGALADHSDADLREPMRVCGERLLALAVAQPVGIGWPPLAGGAPLCSMAHGNAGIALALVEAWQRSGEASLLEGARAALDYEHAAFDEVRGAWPDLRAPDAPPMSTWCHGAPGIALSRARVLQLDDRPSSRQDLARALAVTRAAALRAPHLCCGRAGLSEILRELGAGAEGSTKTTDGWQDLPAAGLMIGLSGVGYGLLARSLPAPRLPSVLRLGS